MANYAIRVQMNKIDLGSRGGPNAIKFNLTTGAYSALPAEVPTNTDVPMTDAQYLGLQSYIGLIKEGVDTSGIETEIATIVAAN